MCLRQAGSDFGPANGSAKRAGRNERPEPDWPSGRQPARLFLPRLLLYLI